MNRCRLLLVVWGLVAGCGDPVTLDPPDYIAWDSFETYGPAPGHGDSYRIIYANPAVRTRGPRDKDAVLVKEIYDNVDNQPGALRYVAIMRKLRNGVSPEDEGGWLFSSTDAPGGAETHSSTCWNRCHVQAPLGGVWLDYTK